MKVLNLLTSGNPGGIESLCKNIALKADFDNRLCFIFSEGSVYEQIVKSNVKVISLRKKKTQLISIIKDITTYCKEEKIDIISMHHGGVYCNIIYILLKKYNPNIKFVRFLHGCYDKYTYGNNGKKINDFIVKKIMNKALQVSDMIISVSKAVEKSFEKNFNIKNKKRVVIYNGIGEEFLTKQLVKRKRNKDGQINIIFIGRLVKVKGVDKLIDAVANLIRDGLNLNLTIVGDGVERNNLENQVKYLNIESNVIFTGFQTNTIDYLDKSDIFVYPSIWDEAFGISVVEAMARGCIPLVANKGGLPEVVDYNPMYIINSNENLVKKLKDVINNIDVIDTKKILEMASRFKIENTIGNLESQYRLLK